MSSEKSIFLEINLTFVNTMSIMFTLFENYMSGCGSVWLEHPDKESGGSLDNDQYSYKIFDIFLPFRRGVAQSG